MAEAVEAPKPKSRWFRVGTHFGPVRVMGVVEGWVVARNKGCAPFLIHANEWHKRMVPADLSPKGVSGSSHKEG